MTTEPLNALNSTATRRGAVQLSRCQSKKLLVRRPQRGPERCANWSGDTCLTPKEDPSAINKTRMPTKSCPARCTPNGPARARRRRVALPEATGGTADAAPRAAGVPRDRAEDRDRGSPQGPKPGAPKRPVAETQARAPQKEATRGRVAGPRTTRQDRGSTKDRRPVAETHANK